MINTLLSLLLATVTIFPGVVAAQSTESYVPKVGQAGKDVVWVPTPQQLVERMLDMAKVTRNDFVVDLGSGDGRTVIAAAKRGINALGIEYNPDMVELSIRNAEQARVSERARFIQGDVFETDFSKATVITMYLLTSLNLKLRPTLLAMTPGTRIVSHAFTMGDWPADETSTADGQTAYLWIVPARVAGRWALESPVGSVQLILDQRYQKFEGRVESTVFAPNVADPSLEGRDIRFTLVDAAGRFVRFRGQVNGDTMTGVVQGEGTGNAAWRAKRIQG